MSHGLLFIMMLIVFILNVLLQVFKVKVPDKFQYITITAATAIVCLRYKLSMAVVMYLYFIVVCFIMKIHRKKAIYVLMPLATIIPAILIYLYDKYWILLVTAMLASVASDFIAKDTNIGILFGVASLGFSLMYFRITGAIALQYYYILLLVVASIVIMQRMVKCKS